MEVIANKLDLSQQGQDQDGGKVISQKNFFLKTKVLTDGDVDFSDIGFAKLSIKS